jgi:hypothetical protein
VYGNQGSILPDLQLTAKLSCWVQMQPGPNTQLDLYVVLRQSECGIL